MNARDTHPLNVSKIEAFRRQLTTAIELLFLEKDPVSIHTLAMAALRIIQDIEKQKGFTSDVDGLIGPDMAKEFWYYARKPSNFFKHADNDPDDILDTFKPRFNIMIIIFSIAIYHKLGYGLTDHFKAYISWFNINHPQVYKPNSHERALIEAARIALEVDEFTDPYEQGRIALKAMGINPQKLGSTP